MHPTSEQSKPLPLWNLPPAGWWAVIYLLLLALYKSLTYFFTYVLP